MLPQRKIKLPTRRSVHYSPHCKGCGKGFVMATFELTPEKELEILTKLNWKDGLCDSCSNPMQVWEMQRMKEFKAEKHPDLITFKFQMIDKYGKEIERFFI